MKHTILFITLFLFAMMNTIAAPLKRVKTVPFPSDFKAWEPQRVLDLERGAIVKIEAGELANKGLETAVQQKLAAACQSCCRFPCRRQSRDALQRVPQLFP